MDYASALLFKAAKPRSIVISLTNKCTAACDGCAFGSHPWVKGGLSINEAIQIVNKAKRELPSIALLVVTGGEPLLRFQDLLILISHAKSLKLKTRIVSNAYWATTPARTDRILNALRKSGLDEINFSTGDEHNKFVPFEQVLFAANRALSLDMIVAIMIEKRKNARITKEVILKHPLGQQMMRKYKGSFIITPSPWIHTEKINNILSKDIVEKSDLVNKDNLHKTSGCDSALRDIAVQPEGDVYACCGITMRKMPSWNMGHINHIDFRKTYTTKATDLLKILIAIQGPAKILAWVSQKDPSITWENQYSHPCEICYHLYNNQKIRTTIDKHKSELANIAILKLFELDLLSNDNLSKASAG